MSALWVIEPLRWEKPTAVKGEENRASESESSEFVRRVGQFDDDRESKGRSDAITTMTAKAACSSDYATDKNVYVA